MDSPQHRPIPVRVDARGFFRSGGLSYPAALLGEANAAIDALVRFAELNARGREHDPPDNEFAYLWDWYCAVTVYRREDKQPIPPGDVIAWCAGRGRSIEPFEFEAMTRIDITRLMAMPKKPVPRGRR